MALRFETRVNNCICRVSAIVCNTPLRFLTILTHFMNMFNPLGDAVIAPFAVTRLAHGDGTTIIEGLGTVMPAWLVICFLQFAHLANG